MKIKPTTKIVLVSAIVGLLVLFSFGLYNSPEILSQEGVVLVAQTSGASTNDYIALSGSEIFGGTEKSFSGVIQVLFNWGIVVALVLAILFIVLGAIQYMTTDAVFDKEEGKTKIAGAIGGLILALVSFTMLQIINPQLVSLRFTMERGSAPIDRSGPTEAQNEANLKEIREFLADIDQRLESMNEEEREAFEQALQTGTGILQQPQFTSFISRPEPTPEEQEVRDTMQNLFDAGLVF